MQGTRVALVALAFHLDNTKSSQFFIDICAEHYEDFHVIADVDAWRDIPRLRPDVLVVWQRMFPPRELDSFGVKNIVLIPMYDACPHTDDFWNGYRPYKILCFSRTLYDFLSSRGFDALRVQYYMRPAAGEIGKRGERRAFYWERSALVDWPCIRSLIAGGRLESLDYHRALNIRERGKTEPSAEEARRLDISFSEWFEDNEAYAEMVRRNTIFFAPREAEGIGLSFIEALAWGLAVVAPNAPTMNEYIEDGVTGFLYDPKTSLFALSGPPR